MIGATQTWDGLRITWEREPRAAAYEVIVSGLKSERGGAEARRFLVSRSRLRVSAPPR
jgi:hypothetical protein